MAIGAACVIAAPAVAATTPPDACGHRSFGPRVVEQALHDLQIRDPAVLLRAAVIDKAARNLLIGATASARRRGTTLKASGRTQGVR